MTYFISKNQVSVTFDDGTTKSVFSDCPRYRKALDAIRAKEPEDVLRSILDGNLFVKRWAAGEFEIVGNKVTWTRRPDYAVPQAVADKLIEFASNGFPAESFVKFLSRLLENPSLRSVETFYGFIEQQGLTIDSEGYVIGYKGVSDQLRDMHTGKFDNSPGRFLEMPRNHVDDDPNAPCSRGSTMWGPATA